MNIAVAFPGLLLALFFAVIFGTGTIGAVLAIAFAITPAFARLTQTLTASVSGRDFIAAAKVCGVGRFRLLTRHILPNIAEPLVINATLAAGAALTAFAGLSFLGIGVQAPSYDWGRLLGEGLNRIYISPLPRSGPRSPWCWPAWRSTCSARPPRPSRVIASSPGTSRNRRPTPLWTTRPVAC